MPTNPRPEDIELPSTVARSDAHARRLYAKTLASAIGTYGEGERARRTAFAALKHSYERVGDRWERKAEKGPSDERAAMPGPRARRGEGAAHGGVDANATVTHLREVARRLGVRGRSRMTKAELVAAIEQANRRAADRARRS